MSITKAANRRDRPWDDNWNNLDDSNQGWADMGQIGLDGEHTARHGGGASAESTAAPGHEVGNGSSDGHEARDLLEDEHHGLVDDDPDEDENHGANAHEPRDGPGPGHDHQGLPGDDHARSGQSDDAHEVQNGLDDDQQGLVDDDENHGEDHAHSSQSGDAHEARDGQDDEHQGVVDEDPNDVLFFELPSVDLSSEEQSVTVIPQRSDEFTCSSCFLVQHRSRLRKSSSGLPICADCE